MTDVIMILSTTGFIGVRKIAPEKIYPPVRVWLRVMVRLRVGGQFSTETIVLEPVLQEILFSSNSPGVF